MNGKMSHLLIWVRGIIILQYLTWEASLALGIGIFIVLLTTVLVNLSQNYKLDLKSINNNINISHQILQNCCLHY